MLAPPGELAPLPRENPGSATESLYELLYKSTDHGINKILWIIRNDNQGTRQLKPTSHLV